MADEYRNFWLVSTCETWAGGQRWKAFCRSFTKQQFLGKVNPSAASTRSSIFRHLLQHGWGTSFCARPQAMGHAIGYARKKHNYTDGLRVRTFFGEKKRYLYIWPGSYSYELEALKLTAVRTPHFIYHICSCPCTHAQLEPLVCIHIFTSIHV
jgi:hypothetical protein